MDAPTYPGKGLSLSELSFALNEELKSVAFSPLYSPDAISQLEQNISTALGVVREWKNTLIRINRVPLDILFLIATHLPSQKDHFHATFVCRHWRRTLLRYGTLWSQLYLKRGEVYTKTLLERAMGSPLDIVVNQNTPVSSIAPLSSHAEKIRHLKFMDTSWAGITAFSVYSGPLPLLDTLDISASGFDDAFSETTIFPSYASLGGAMNLKKLVLDSGETYLNRFAFPNLITFEVSASPAGGFNVPDFLNFLKASPALQTVKLKVDMVSTLVGNPQEVVVLPNLHTFSLIAIDGAPMYDIATFVSCPRARHTSLEYTVESDPMTPHLEMFPSPISWNTIVHQYTKNPAGEVELEIPYPGTIKSSLTFRSSDSALILGFHAPELEEHEDMSSEEIYYQLFSQTYRSLQNHPQLSHIKRLDIKSRTIIAEPTMTLLLANQVGRLLGSLGPLDQLTLDCLDPHILIPFLGFKYLNRPIVFPPIREPTISHPLFGPVGEVEFADAIVGLAKSQHERGIPFEHVTIRTRELDTTMEEMLRQWVGVVDYFEDWQVVG